MPASRFVRWWAGSWATVLVVVFAGTTALTLSVWANDPARAPTSPTVDVAFLCLGLMIATGLATQASPRWTDVALAGGYQAVLASGSLAVAGAAGARVEPLVGGLLFVVVSVTALRAHAPRRTTRSATRFDWLLGVLAVLAAVPMLALAAASLARARSAGPSCFFGACARGDRYAELAATLVAIELITILAAGRLPGWRLPACMAGASAAVIGVIWVMAPLGADAFPVGVVIAAWGVVVLVVANRPGARQG